jgi:ethanolamine ammonia-lyase small subunit
VPNSTPSRPTSPLPTTARLSLGNPSPNLSTADHLRFQLDHALARDAVHTQLDTALLLRGLHDRNLPSLLLQTNAPDRRTYLRRPDLGRTLHPTSIAALQSTTNPGVPSVDSDGRHATLSGANITFILADGLSALALERHALPLLDATLPLIPNPVGVPSDRSSSVGWCSLIPVLTNARVAIGDQIGHLLNAQLTVLLIGERPGLSSPDSLGVYLTWNPRPGRTDAERNCISNIRGDQGLSYTEAAHRIAHYLAEARRLHTTGIALKDPATTPLLPE